MIAYCTATKTNGKRCKVSVKYPDLLCHIHKPEGKFQQKLNGFYTCPHRYFMRDPGIVCVDCGDVWSADNG